MIEFSDTDTLTFEEVSVFESHGVICTKNYSLVWLRILEHNPKTRIYSHVPNWYSWNIKSQILRVTFTTTNNCPVGIIDHPLKDFTFTWPKEWPRQVCWLYDISPEFVM